MGQFENPKTTHYEFMGMPGAIMMIVGLPITVYGLFFMCNAEKGDCSVTSLPGVDSIPPLRQWVSLEATLVILAWFAFQSFLYIVVPGEVHKGLPLRDGTRLSYKCNGRFDFTAQQMLSVSTVLHLLTCLIVAHVGCVCLRVCVCVCTFACVCACVCVCLLFFFFFFFFFSSSSSSYSSSSSSSYSGLGCFVITMALTAGLQYHGIIDLAYIYDNFLQLMTSAMLFCLALSVFLYLKALQPGTMLAEGGNSGEFSCSSSAFPASHPFAGGSLCGRAHVCVCVCVCVCMCVGIGIHACVGVVSVNLCE